MLEDNLRTLFNLEAGADQPPSHISVPAAGRSAGLRQRQRRALTIGSPVLAAAAVIAVIATLVALAGGARSPGPAPAALADLSSVPPYYMALLPTTVRGNIYPSPYAVIRNTVTGATVATVRPPRPFRRFSLVVAGADDRTFILAAQKGPTGARSNTPARLYRARFSPASGRVSLRPLPGPEFPATAWLSGLALAPNGTTLAVVLEHQGSGGFLYTQLRTYSLAGSSLTGNAVKVWQDRGFINGLALLGFNAPCLSWGSDGILAFNWAGDGKPADDGIRLLNTGSASGSLVTGSRLAVGQDVPGGLSTFPSNDGFLTANGKIVVDAVSRERSELRVPGRPPGHHAVQSEFREFSAATGKTLRVFWPTRSFSEWVEWSSSSGSVLVVAAPVRSGSESGDHAVFGVLSGNRFVPIPRAPAAIAPWTALVAF